MEHTFKSQHQVPTVLVVDDSRVNVEILRQILASGFQTFRACNGQQALDLARAYPPDIILLDVEMPGMDGYQVCSILKSDPRTSDIPVVFVTGMEDRESFDRGLAAGAVGFLSKPVNPNVVRRQVHIQLELARAQKTTTISRARSAEPAAPPWQRIQVG
jgi:CheY-like chemotaxis protein